MNNIIAFIKNLSSILLWRLILVTFIVEREYILSGVGVKKLFYATNNNAPRQPITLNLIHLITYDYNPCNILKLKRILLSDLSHLYFSLPFIKTQHRSASPTPPPIWHHPTMMLQQPSPENWEAWRRSARAWGERVFPEKLSSLLWRAVHPWCWWW